VKRFMIVFERTRSGYSVFAPDLPGCIATGKTRKAAERRMREAVEFHIDGLRRAGGPVPRPNRMVGFVEVAA